MIELQWRLAKPDDTHKFMVLFGDNYISMVLQYRGMQVLESGVPFDWGEWKDVPAVNKE